MITVLDTRLSEQIQVDGWQDQMSEAIRLALSAGVVIDMMNVEYMTSMAIFPLVSARAVADEVGAKIILCNLSPTVLKVLTITQLIVESRAHVRHLAMAKSLDDAIAALSRQV